MVFAMLQHSWRKVSVINIMILIVLVVVYAFACGFRNIKWMDNGEAYGQARMTKSKSSRGPRKMKSGLLSDRTSGATYLSRETRLGFELRQEKALKENFKKDIRICPNSN
ncbi:hypothetical protein HPP92_027826 [Vanilla planifolia]|uniref:Uncharacterized protein n=1 Tax=Vanilla planifolia TaxID=51239 RepID=A0A835U5C7_VANPL|nr:hypothetical protein HPP92_027826 [Vanilla planifolia]